MTTTDTQTNDLIEQVERSVYDIVAVWNPDDAPDDNSDYTLRWEYVPDDLDWEVEGGFNKALIQEIARAAVLAVRRHDARGYGDRDEVLQAAVREYQSLVKSDLRTEALVSYVIRVATVERLRQAEEASR